MLLMHMKNICVFRLIRDLHIFDAILGGMEICKFWPNIHKKRALRTSASGLLAWQVREASGLF
jgi:hypothetical protein